MRKHTALYLKHFDLPAHQDTVIMCERCECARSVDIHHLERRGMGGSKTADRIENLAALCRECHTIVEAQPAENAALKQKHLILLAGRAG